jgi:hypothetical protein
MQLKKYQTYFYYGTGADQTQFQRELSFYIDTAVYENLKNKIDVEHSTDIYEWQDLNITPAETVNLVNKYLGFNLFNNGVKYYFSNPTTDEALPTDVKAATDQMNLFGLSYNKLVQHSGDRTQTETDITFLNGEEPAAWSLSTQQYVRRTTDPQTDVLQWYISNTGNASMVEMAAGQSGNFYLIIKASILPDDFFLSDKVNSAYSNTSEYQIICTITGKVVPLFPFIVQKINNITLTCGKTSNLTYISFNGINLIGTAPTEDDISNPYGTGGISGPGGGNGTLKPGDLDSIDPAEIPDLPSISAANLGFITMYNPTVAQLHALSDFMWSGAFDLATYKKLFSDPMQSIIGLAIVPVQPTVAGSKNVHFGSIDSGVSMPYLSTNYVRVDCGWCDVERYIGCFMDNEPYTKISIYLPFIGIRQISADDVIGGSIHAVYNIDVLSGACACFIEHNSRGVLYSYNGSCITNVPLTAVNFSGAIQNAVSAIGSAVGMVAGMATGAAPVAAMGAVGLLTSAANTALNSKPQVQRSGNLGGSAGIMSIMTPYVIIERPSLSVPNNVQHYVGQTSNITMSLGSCRGFTLCEYVHIDNVSATTEEIAEIESLLKQGVIL